MSSSSPTLWVVATPLGNLGDLSERARDVLSKVDLVLAEDTRRTGMLMQRLGIKSNGFVSLHEHNEEKRINMVLSMLERGDNLALVSDAGTPLMSDPGYRVVRACREKGFKVVPVPGPCAPVTALCACGLPPYPSTFLGFLPRKASHVKRLLALHGETGATIVFFERKSRLKETLENAYEALGGREFAICRELTKEYEEFIFGKLGELDEMDLELRGEITVVVGPPEKPGEASEEDILELIEEERESGGKPKEVARRVASRVQGWTAKAVYERMN